MSSTEAIVYSTLDITERTVLPRSDDESLWDKVLPAAAFECPEALLLVWPIFGPIIDIAVLNSTAAPGEAFKNRQPFVIENPDGSKTFHPYVTPGEAVSAIHEWLLTMQEDILIAERAQFPEDGTWGCQTPLPSTDTKFWVSGLWGTNVMRQGGVGSGEQSKWDPETGEGCPQTEEWEELLGMANGSDVTCVPGATAVISQGW
ncbi:hypothetical protein K4K58_012191 [Colletotrichum sp. SAR11_239]|nr:hypothetical protein K4K58_012191 [Colletotrichum sp. SAR11_239]